MPKQNYPHHLKLLLTEPCEIRFLSINSFKYTKLGADTTVNIIFWFHCSERIGGKRGYVKVYETECIMELKDRLISPILLIIKEMEISTLKYRRSYSLKKLLLRQ